MPRIATLTTILAIAVAPTALARPAGPRHHARLSSSHANVKLVSAAPAAKPSKSDGDSDGTWAILGVAIAAVVGAAALTVKATRQAGPPARA